MKRIILPILALVLAFSLQAQEALKREMRTVWIATVSNIDWPQTRGTGTTTINKQKKQLTDMLDGFAATNMNGVCLQVRPMADALYHSSYEPWSSYLTGTRGKDPGWDPLAFAVEECHKRGIECHAWVNPYRFSNSSGNDCTTPQDEELKQSGMLMTVGNRIVFNPALKASRDRLLAVCREMIENYDIDGIIFDDYFYPGGGTPTDSSAPDYQLWQQSGSGMSIGDWRRANVNLMVREMYEMVQTVKPYVKFGIGPAGVAGTRATSAGKHGIDPCPTGSDWQYDQIYSDPVAWLHEGTIDYISPQLYWKTTHTTNPFGPLTQWWSYCAEHFGRHHYASTNIYFMASTNTLDDWQEINKQILLTRQYAAPGTSGVNFYSAKYINGPTCTGLGNYLAQNTFTTKALTPCMGWKPKEDLGSPTGVKFNGNTLSWNAVDKHLVKYAVYAIPTSVPVEDINSSLYGGIKGDYLVNFTYSPSMTLDAKYLDGYWFAVTIVDGWGNEFAPTYLNAPAYVMKQDIDTYDRIGNLEFTNKWVRSIKDEYANMSFDSNGLMNRGFTVKGNSILVIGRDAGSSTAQVYIDHYSTDTGERIKRVNVDNQVQCLYFPGNDIFLDAAGNVCVSNLVLNIKTQPITIYQVDPDTGAATLRASLTTTLASTSRIDHCNVYGDVTSNQFYVFAAMSSGTQVVRWTITNGAVSDTQVMTAQAYSPSNAGGWNIAPRVYPVSPTQVYVTGAATYPTLYNFSTGAIIDNIVVNTSIIPESTQANGLDLFTLAGHDFALYPYSSHLSDSGFRFILTQGDEGYAPSTFEPRWIFPAQGLGGVNSSTWDAPCVSTTGATPRERDIYIYVPGNGLAAYTLRDVTPLRGDINLDGVVDVDDVNILVNLILNGSPATSYDGRADLNADSILDVDDINILVTLILAN